MTLSVSDVKRSLAFYQGLFRLPIQARQGPTPCLRVGRGPEFIALSQTAANVTPRINHYCVTVEDFDVDHVLGILAEHGVTRIEAAGAGGPMAARVRRLGPDAGGAPGGTPELYVTDPSGVVVQVQAPTYCGGAGALGEVCPATPDASPTKGLLTTGVLSHFTMRTPDAARAERFYRDVFAMPVLAYQGKTPALKVGPHRQFLMMSAMAAGASATEAARTGSIHHACLTVDDFDVERIFKVLDGYGLKPRGNSAGTPPPLVYYVTMRLPDCGGAPGGTPELYFTDPDGLLIQLQAHSYCGGGGRLGEVCA